MNNCNVCSILFIPESAVNIKNKSSIGWSWMTNKWANFCSSSGLWIKRRGSQQRLFHPFSCNTMTKSWEIMSSLFSVEVVLGNQLAAVWMKTKMVFSYSDLSLSRVVDRVNLVLVLLFIVMFSTCWWRLTRELKGTSRLLGFLASGFSEQTKGIGGAFH